MTIRMTTLQQERRHEACCFYLPILLLITVLFALACLGDAVTLHRDRQRMEHNSQFNALLPEISYGRNLNIFFMLLFATVFIGLVSKIICLCCCSERHKIKLTVEPMNEKDP